MATLGEVLKIASAFSPGSGIGKVGDVLTARRDKRRKRNLNKEALAIQKERNQILKDRAYT